MLSGRSVIGGKLSDALLEWKARAMPALSGGSVHRLGQGAEEYLWTPILEEEPRMDSNLKPCHKEHLSEVFKTIVFVICEIELLTRFVRW